MPSEKTLAIVIRVVEFSESSCIVTLFTRDFGKIAALAKGARRPKSPFESALDLLAVCRIVFLHKSSDALDLLTEAKLERRFRAAARDLARLYGAYYVAELLREMTDNGDPHPELFDAAVEALADLDGESDVARVILRFEMTALRLLGHLPALHGCASCGREVEVTGRVRFGLWAGGLLCEQCRPGQRQVVNMSAAAVGVLRQFAANEGYTWRDQVWDGPTFGEVRGVIGQYLCQLLDHRPRMHRYLGLPGQSSV